MGSYRLLTHLVAPVLPLWIGLRAWRGKEEWARRKERFGIATIARPKGQLLWLHAASVGEANSVLPLMAALSARFPQLRLLLTTGTVTSAKLMQQRLPAGVIHQYAPLDTPRATHAFIRHWQPDIALWVESELWPNLIEAADAAQCFMAIINGRMSERSLRGWKKWPTLIASLLKRFDLVVAQTLRDGERFQALGAKEALCLGNLKYDAARLPCDEGELLALKNAIGERPLWLAASTHPGEEAMVAGAHRLLAATRPGLLTIIVPRHPNRGAEIAAALGKQLRVALRSKGEVITEQTQLYIADTLGELGLFYRLSEIVFMGGSLVAHGGQNPLEAARLSCAILTGPKTHNFAAVYREMESAKLCRRVVSAQALASEVGGLLSNALARHAMQDAASQWVEAQGGATQRLVELLTPLFEAKTKAP